MSRLSLETSQRIISLRFLLIVMVVFAHANVTEVKFVGGVQALEIPNMIRFIMFAISEIITRSEVSVFFFVSGLLLYSKDYSFASVFKKRGKSIMLPYILWSCIMITVFFILQSVPFSKEYFSNPQNLIRNFGAIDWIDAFVGKFTEHRNNLPFVYQFWFLRDLFIMSLLFLVVKRVVDASPKIVFVIMLLLWVCNIELYVVSTRALLFFSLAYYATKYSWRIEHIDSIPFVKLALVYVAFVISETLLFYTESKLIVKSLFELLGTNSLDVSMEFIKMFLHAFNVILGFMFLLRISAYFIRNEKLYNTMAWLAGFNFFVYASHEPILTILTKLSSKFLQPQGAMFLVQYFILTISVIVITLCMGIVVKKLFPRVYAILTGGRLQQFFVPVQK